MQHRMYIRKVVPGNVCIFLLCVCGLNSMKQSFGFSQNKEIFVQLDELDQLDKVVYA